MAHGIVVQNLGKRFSAYPSDRPRTIMQAAMGGFKRLQPINHFWALRNISFEVQPGEILGILGHNGAGKSTLLRLIGGIGSADEGQIHIRGRVGALLDLGAGFHEDLTGRENLLVSALIGGLTRAEALARQEQIIEFAELETFIDNPIRTYSTGMGMRLAFSIAIHTDPQLLLVDEHLSVGDIGFQAKCIERVRALRDQGCAIILISQSPKQVIKVCDRALLLNRGKIAAYSDPETVVAEYKAAMHPDQKPRLPQVNAPVLGEKIAITAMKLSPPAPFHCGDPLTIELHYECFEALTNPVFSVRILHGSGAVCFDSNTQSTHVHSRVSPGTGRIRLQVDRLDLNGGQYFVSAGVHSHNWESLLEYQDKMQELIVEPTQIVEGLIHPPCLWSAAESVPVVPTLRLDPKKQDPLSSEASAV
jgi:lipopolysaccharide transport system ATP-binding protein